MRISLYDVAKRLLGSFDAELAKYAEGKFKRRGIDLKMGHHVERVEAGKLHVKEQGEGMWQIGSTPGFTDPCMRSAFRPSCLVDRSGAQSAYRFCRR